MKNRLKDKRLRNKLVALAIVVVVGALLGFAASQWGAQAVEWMALFVKGLWYLFLTY